MANPELVALVTGANRGLGLETSRQLAARGVTVIMSGRKADAIHAAADALAAEGLSVLPTVLDVTDPAQIEAVRQKIEADFGRLDILINNAGAINGETFFGNSAAEVPIDGLRATLESNFVGPVALTQALLPLLKAAPAARVVNLSSIVGSLAVHRDWEGEFAMFADFKPMGYSASKAALNMFTVHLAALLRHTPIKVNSAHPGWVKTELGTDAAPMDVVDGAKTAVELALLGPDGPTGAFVHMGQPLPW